MTPLAFLQYVFQHPSLDNLVIAIWDKQTKRTETFRIGEHLVAAANDALIRAESCDVYVGTCPYRRVNRGSRGTVDQVGALVALWIDIDIYDEIAHRNTNLPPNRDAALELLRECDRRPSITLNTGYGLQAWWLLREPFLITDDQTRKKAERMARGWVDHVRSKAAPHGWHIDPVGDLARVLRLPGTWNRKAEPRAVEVIEA